MPPNPDTLITHLDQARTALNNARNAVEQWKRGQVAGVAHTAGQRSAIRTIFENALQDGKDRIADVDTELTN